MIRHTIEVAQLTPDQFAELVEQRSYLGMKRALAEYTPNPAGTDLPLHMTRKEVAAYLRVSLTTLHAWANDTDDRSALLVPLMVNGRVRYRRDDVLTLQKEHRRFKTSKAGESRGV